MSTHAFRASLIREIEKQIKSAQAALYSPEATDGEAYTTGRLDALSDILWFVKEPDL